MAVTTTSGVTDLFFDGTGGGGTGIGSMQITEVNSAYTALISDDIIVATGTFTIDLPLVASGVKSLTIKSVLGGGTITVDANGAELIEGMATQTVTVGTSITIAPTTTTDWVII